MMSLSNKLLLTVSWFCFYGTFCHASQTPPEDFDPNKRITNIRRVDSNETQGIQRKLSKDEIEDLTPLNPELEQLANEGNLDAMNRLAVCLVTGIDCEKDKNKGDEWMILAANKGHPGAMRNYGTLLIMTNDHKSVEAKHGFLFIKKAAEAGHDQSKYDYALCLLEGKGCIDSRKNQMLGWNKFKELANQGDEDAMFMLAKGCLYGIGSDKAGSQKEGMMWLKKAADLDHPEALRDLGWRLQEGRGCEFDQEAAFKCFKQAAFLGNIDAVNDLCICLEGGIGCQKTRDNQALAIKFYMQLAKRGDYIPMLNLARCFEIGLIVPQDIGKAEVLYKKAAETRQPVAIYNLALYYFYNKKYDLALPLLNKVKSQYKIAALIGFIHFKNKNYKEALQNYEEAEKNGTEVSAAVVKVNNDVNPRFLSFLRNKVSQTAAKGDPLSKPMTKNIVPELAKYAQEEELNTLQTDAVSLKKQLISKLEEIKADANISGTQEFDADRELENLNKTYQMFTSGLEEMDMLTKSARIKSLKQIMTNLEEKIIVFEQQLASRERVAQLRRIAIEWKENPAQGEMETRQDKNMKKEVQAKAEEILSAAKGKAHKKKTRKHKKKPKGKNIKVEPAQVVEIIKKEGPFSNMKKPKERTQAKIPTAAWNNVNKITDTLRDVQSMDEAIFRLGQLEGDFNFLPITSDYAGIPNAHRAFEMRINLQYRAIIAFEELTVQVYEQGEDGINNNNNPVEKKVYQLYGNRIYIDDLHIKN